MGILEFDIFGCTGRCLWRPANTLARMICVLVNRKNLTKEQIDMCRELGFEIKENVTVI